MKKNPEQKRENDQLKTSTENLTKPQVNKPFCEAVEKIMGGKNCEKDLLTERRKPEYHEKITLT